MTPGLIALIVAFACALAGGVVSRRNNGRMRTVGARGRVRVPAVSGPGGGENGVMAAVARPGGSAPAAASADDSRLTGEQLGRALGARATLVQFSSAFCAPCRATRRILTEVAGMTDGVAFIEVDAESRLDLVRRLNVLRTPTVLVTDGEGRITKRASGQPRKADVIAALGDAVGATIPIFSIGNEDSDSSRRRA